MLGHGARGVDGATHKPPNHDSVSPPPTKTTPTTPTPTPPSPTPCATCWALSACSDLIPTHQLAEGLYQTPLCTAHARNLVYTAARGQGRRFRLTRPGFNLAPAPTIYRISQPCSSTLRRGDCSVGVGTKIGRGYKYLQKLLEINTRIIGATCLPLGEL